MFDLIVKMLIFLMLANISSDVAKIRKSLQSIRVEANTASELIKYWMPPISENRMGTQCGRCHR